MRHLFSPFFFLTLCLFTPSKRIPLFLLGFLQVVEECELRTLVDSHEEMRRCSSRQSTEMSGNVEYPSFNFLEKERTRFVCRFFFLLSLRFLFLFFFFLSEHLRRPRLNRLHNRDKKRLKYSRSQKTWICFH